MKWWRTQDWLWTISFLLYAVTFSFLYREFVKDVISYVSTFVSFALGGVAIYISIRDVTNGDNVKNETFKILGKLEEKLSQMDDKINKFNPAQFNEEKDMEIEAMKESLKHEILNNLPETISKQEITDTINSKLEEATEFLKSSLTINNIDLDHNNKKELILEEIDRVILEAPQGTHVSTKYIHSKLLNEKGIRVPVSLMAERIHRWFVLGKLEKMDGKMFKPIVKHTIN